MGMVWIVLGIASIFYYYPEINYGISIFFIFSISYFIQYFYENKHGYLSLTEGMITKHNFFKSKTVKIDEIKSINSLAGEYTVSTKDQHLKFSKQLANFDDLKKLEVQLNKIKKKK